MNSVSVEMLLAMIGEREVQLYLLRQELADTKAKLVTLLPRDDNGTIGLPTS